MPTADPDVREVFHALRDAVERRTVPPDIVRLRARIDARRRARVAVPVMAAVVSSALVITVVVGATIRNDNGAGRVSVAPAAPQDPASGATGTPDVTSSPSASVPPAGPEAQPSGPGSGGADPAPRNTPDQPTRRATPSHRAVTASSPTPTSELPVLVNADFEAAPVTVDGLQALGEPAGWSGGYGVRNPPLISYPRQDSAGITGTMKGPTVGFLTMGSAISQQTRAVALPGSTYTFTLAVGARQGELFAATALVITADGAPVATTAVATAPTAGDFADVTVRWTPTAADAGKRVGVSVLDISPLTTAVVDVDNARLTVTPPVRVAPAVAPVGASPTH